MSEALSAAAGVIVGAVAMYVFIRQSVTKTTGRRRNDESDTTP